LNRVWDTAEKFGFSRPDGNLLNRTLLGSENTSLSGLVQSYGAFANEGKMMTDLVWITKIVDAKGKELKAGSERINCISDAYYAR